jgi:hypothetical protein
MTALSATQFRALFPAFRDPAAFVDGEVEAWLDIADKALDPMIWANYRDLAMALFTAHNIVLSRRDEKAADSGGVPGSPVSGVVASKSVGAVSISYDTQAGLEQNAGAWNLTNYGTRFYRLMRLAGMGGTQLGGPDVQLGPTFGPAWPGVLE